MPNWCANRLYVSGSDGDLAVFARIAAKGLSPAEALEAAALLIVSSDENQDPISTALLDGDSAGILSFSGHLPEPSDVQASGTNQSIDWRNGNWGTKWEPSGSRFDTVTHGTYRYQFDTAWAPPTAWLATVAAMHPSLSFALQWNEEQGIGGWFEYSNGALVSVGDTGDFETMNDDLGWPDAPFIRSRYEDDEDEDHDGPNTTDLT